jgi:prevent-host-death family protein
VRAVTIKDAKAHLNELVQAAQAGEQVVLMRGAKHVAAIIPINEQNIELALELTDDQAARFWRQLASEQASGTVAAFGSAERAVQHLRRPKVARPRRRPSRV